jgi:site-specific DNA-methyltransferase (adenine-specific)
MLHLGDCLDVMQGIPDGSVDMVCTDPPYGTTACKWDSVIPFEPMWAQLKRIVKPNGAIVLMASQPFTSALVMSNVKMFSYSVIWHKSRPVGHLAANRKPMNKHEDILIFSKNQPTYNPQGVKECQPKTITRTNKGGIYRSKAGVASVQKFTGYPNSIIEFNSQNGQLHPTQKPVALMEYLIRTYTNPGETVLDFTMGSGTTGVAAANTGRRFIGIERDTDYFTAASARIQKAQADAITNKMREATSQ